MIALAAGVYLVIAVGRSGLYAMFHVPPANAAIVDRYHYVGAIPIAVLLCLVLRELAPALRPPQAALALIVALACLVAGKLMVGVPIEDYRFVKEYVWNAAEEIEREVLAHPPGSIVHLENEATPHAVLGSTLPQWALPGRAGVFVLFHPTDQLEARLVRFIERDEEVATFYRERPYTRFNRLLVRPGDAPR